MAGFASICRRRRQPRPRDTRPHSGHLLGAVGRSKRRTSSPDVYLRSFNFSHLPEDERARCYREKPRPDGSLLREYQIFAVDREIEIAPGVKFPAWTYNGQVPGPTIRATEGDLVRVHFVNQGSHPHTIHFHGWHPPAMDGSLPEHQVLPGARLHLRVRGRAVRRCTSITAMPFPLKRHIHKGLYGMFIVDPKGSRELPRPAAPTSS